MSGDVKQMEVGSVEMHKVMHDGIEIAYWVHGEGAPLLVLTGLATAAASWGPLPSLLGSQGYKAIVVENRDAGFSGRATDGYEIRDMAADAVAVLDALGIERTYVLGISLGGMIAQEIALGFPERVERLVLIATDPGNPVRVSGSPEWWGSFLSVPSQDPHTYMKTIITMMTGEGFGEHNPGLIENSALRRLNGNTSDAGAFGRQAMASVTFSAADRLKELDVPTLIIHGEQDPMIPFENAKTLAALIPNAELVAIADCGHLVPLEAPSETIGALMRFLPTHAGAK